MSSECKCSTASTCFRNISGSKTQKEKHIINKTSHIQSYIYIYIYHRLSIPPTKHILSGSSSGGGSSSSRGRSSSSSGGGGSSSSGGWWC